MKTKLLLCISTLLLIISVFAAIISCKIVNIGYLYINVFDGFTSLPIENARVVIPEIDSEFYTDDNGSTDKIKVPLLMDTHFNSIHKQEYGTITVIVYADGYTPYALFFTQIYKNETRSPNIWLFEDDGAKPFIIIESPNELWAYELINKYSCPKK